MKSFQSPLSSPVCLKYRSSSQKDQGQTQPWPVANAAVQMGSNNKQFQFKFWALDLLLFHANSIALAKFLQYRAAKLLPANYSDSHY